MTLNDKGELMIAIGIHLKLGCIVKFPIHTTGWLSNSEWYLLDHFPTEIEYFQIMKDCDIEYNFSKDCNE